MLPTSGSAGMAPVSLTIHDSPPANVAVLSFEITVTGASLQPSNMSMQPVPLMARPTEIELEHLQTESALLANLNVPAGTYNGVTVTFANPEMTILNQTGSALTVNGQSCLNGQVCEVTPKLNSAMVSVQAPTAPFPITLSSTSPLALELDFNVDASVQSADLSITPSVSLKQLPISPGGEMEEEMDFAGRITAIDQTNKTFTLQVGRVGFSGQSVTIATDSNTQFDFGSTCSADNFSCLMVGEFVKVEASLTAPGATPLAKEVELLVPGVNQLAILGLVSNVNVAQNQFQIAVRDVEGEFVNIAQPAISFGPITVQVQPQAAFSINTDNLTLPAVLSFTGVSDMVIGQGVEVHLTGFALNGTPPNVTITVNTDQVRLEPSPVTATVSAINSGASPPNFVLGNLQMFFTSNGITSIQVDVLSTTQFFNDPTVLTGLKAGDLVSSGGLLFKGASASTPIQVAEKVVKRFPNGTN
jgi:hypothetical protein